MSGAVLPVPTVRRRLVRGGLFSSAARISGIALAQGVGMVVARVLPGEFGILAVLMSTVVLCSMLTRWGQDRVAGRLLPTLQTADSARPLMRRVMRTTLLSVPIVGTVLTAVIFGVWSALRAEPISGLLIALVWVALLGHAVLQVLSESLRGFHRSGAASAFDATLGVVSNVGFLFALGCLLLMSRSLTLTHGVGAFAASVLLPIPFAAILVRQTMLQREADLSGNRASTQTHSYRLLTALGAQLAFLTMVEFFLAQIDVWVAGAVLEGNALSLFVAARKLMQVVAMPLMLVNLAIASSIAEFSINSDSERLQKLIRNSSTLAALPSLCCLMAFIAGAELVLTLMFGTQFAEAAPILRILCLGQVPMILTGPCGNVLLQTGHHRSAITASVIIVLAYGIAVAVCWSSLTMTSIAVLTVIASTLRNISLWIITRRVCGIWTHPGFSLPRLPRR